MRLETQARKNTCDLCARDFPNHIFADNPHKDKGVLYEMFDSLVDYSNVSVSNVSNDVSN